MESQASVIPALAGVEGWENFGFPEIIGHSCYSARVPVNSRAHRLGSEKASGIMSEMRYRAWQGGIVTTLF